MAITIRTGANGSYKSAYAAWFTILPALKAGRVVVTNFEGMEPLHIIEQRLDIKFPSTAKLIRIFSRSEKGIRLWHHFFCWCPLNALIVIDECQDLYSRNIGFDMKKITYKPIEDFKDDLPDWYIPFFHSRHVPVNMSELKPSEIDDCEQAEYTPDGRIIYPLTFNEGFTRHRKYNWDIELLSPDWKQIDSAMKACSEQSFFHKNNDGFFWSKRKPYVYKHDKSVATTSLPKGKDPNLLKVHVPLDAHLLYKSTGTGQTTQSGGMNVLFKSPKIIGALVLSVFCLGYFVYALSSLVFGGSEEVEEQGAPSVAASQSAQQVDALPASIPAVSDVLPDGGDSHSTVNNEFVQPVLVNTVPDFVPIESLVGLYMTSFTYVYPKDKYGEVTTRLSLRAKTLQGDFHINDRFLKRFDIAYHVLDECLLELTHSGRSFLIGCPPTSAAAALPSDSSTPSVNLF
ncbi:toxin [Vibrio sp. Of7-15]|uniref:zonular occludens toxin domain-containing protein n=1 Tax=Vibrio sp. Of7-15 TaxID=2724879 RepID=UPI001EF1A56B|nr:zonular occludens toxin domain-containing protein [Vibrio sp. Of7-15]MCG7500066.1 toxin [Vibrio sp. Of7-15]